MTCAVVIRFSVTSLSWNSFSRQSEENLVNVVTGMNCVDNNFLKRLFPNSESGYPVAIDENKERCPQQHPPIEQVQ